MDSMTTQLAEFAATVSYDQLPRDIVARANRHLLDTIGCAIGGFSSPQAKIASAISVPAKSDADHRLGSVVGASDQTTAEHAAFSNTCMIRNLDYNDFYPASHPSDTIGALLALAGREEVDGRRLLTALVVAYEVCGRISDASDMRRKGWDQGYAIGLATVAGLGSMLSLPAETIGQALAITATANVHLRSSRAGQLSLWKGGATAYATRNGTFAIQLAENGMTGPDRPFDGRHGLFEQITGPFVLAPFPVESDVYLLRKTSLKYWPVEFNAQVAVWAARRLAAKMPLERLATVRLGTYWSSWHEIGSEDAKWDPQSRETADHSMPYIFVRTLIDGELDLSAFDASKYLDPALRPELAKVTVEVDSGPDEAWPEHVLLRVDATSVDGEEMSFVEEDPRGFWTNPMSDEDVTMKFASLATPVYGEARSKELTDYWGSVEDKENLHVGLDMLKRI